MANRMSPAGLQSGLPLKQHAIGRGTSDGPSAAETTAHCTGCPRSRQFRPAIRPVTDFSNPIQEEIKCATPTQTN